MLTEQADTDSPHPGVISAASDAYIAARLAVVRLAKAEGVEIPERDARDDEED